MKENSFEIYRSIFQKMGRISVLHRNIFERNVSDMEIHHSQHRLLMYIAKQGEVTSQKILAEKFCISPAAIARTLKELETEGYIKRSSIENDSRFNKIVITDKGKDIVSKSYAMFKETDENAFADYSDDDIELLNQYLDKIQARLLEKYEEYDCARKTDEKE